ncbi:hypothetical protein ZWY2020_024455 [Hordeum vulgare]|nr:hypothetical protein ZWY2020_024455 [Hordeum vulgare]
MRLHDGDAKVRQRWGYRISRQVARIHPVLPVTRDLGAPGSELGDAVTCGNVARLDGGCRQWSGKGLHDTGVRGGGEFVAVLRRPSDEVPMRRGRRSGAGQRQPRKQGSGTWDLGRW